MTSELLAGKTALVTGSSSGIGRWNDYLYGEKVYLVLSLVAKSVLAWFIYFGSLAN